jgi:hypothetical protein
MKTFMNIVLCVLATIIASPAAAVLINLIIDMSVWLSYFASSITFVVVDRVNNDIGWAVISASIAKFFVPFYGASTIVELGNGSKYTWPPAVSFFLSAVLLATYNVYFLMTMVSSN